MNTRQIFKSIFCFHLVLLTPNIFAERKISLQAPQFTDDDIIGANAGIRPYREDGLNLEKTYIQDRVLYHNYGHGGAGASLAYGSVKYVVDQFIKDKHPDENIAVLGSGYMGLITANELVDKGYKVKVYADLFPQVELQIQKLCLTSLIAGGLWMPFGIKSLQNTTLHNEIIKTSFDFYKSAIDQKLFRGLKFAKVYTMGTAKPDHKSLPPGTIEEAEKVEIEFGNGKYFPAYESTTILLDGYIFLNELFEKAKQKGVIFVNHHFDTNDDFLVLDEKILFNCLGYGSKLLLGDEKMHGKQGQHLYLRPQVDVNYFLFSSKASGRPMSLYPSETKLASGFSYEDSQGDPKVNPMMHEQFKQELHEFFKDKVPNLSDLQKNAFHFSEEL